MPGFVNDSYSGSTFEQEASATLRDYFDGGEPQELIVKNSPFLKRLKSKDKIKRQNGFSLVKPIEYAFGHTAQFISGHERFNVNPGDIVTTVELPWKEAVASTSWSRFEKNRNSGGGPNQVFDLVKTKIDNCRKELQDLILFGVHSDGTPFDGKCITGYKSFNGDTNTGAYAGIDPTVTGGAFWKNRVYSAATDGGTTFSPATARELVYKTLVPLGLAGKGPDFGIAPDDWFIILKQATVNPYESKLSEDLVSEGWDGINICGVDIVNEGGYFGTSNAGFGAADPTSHYMSSSRLRFFSTDYIYFIVNSGNDMVTLDEVRPGDQTSVMQTVYWMGNLICTHRAMQATLKP